MKEFNFQTQLVMSAGTSVTTDICALLLANIPGTLGVEKANERDDRSGTDYWLKHARGTPISVDTKIRDVDPVVTYGRDDLALETWSVIGKKVGWTLDETKRTDFILWWFTPTRRWVLVPFVQLQAAFLRRRERWEMQYRTAKQRTVGSPRGDWFSECVFVPREEIWDAIRQDFGGAPGSGAPHAIQRHGSQRTPAPRDSLQATARRPVNQCERCQQVAVITLSITDRLGDQIVCSGCWKEMQAA